MTDEAQGIPRDITPEEVCRLVTGALYPKEMALLQETQRQLDEERRMLDETRERCKALESELSSARMRIDKPLRDAWLGEALETLADNAVVYRVALAQGEWPEKCPDCDDRRKVRFTSPQGHEYSETCDKCGNRIVRFEPEEVVLKQLRSGRWNGRINDDGTIESDLLYEARGDRDSSSRCYELRDIVREEPEGGFDSAFVRRCEDDEEYVDYGSALFATEELCRSACEWANERVGYPKKEAMRIW